jgi:Glycolipid transfer protein (GLTP)
MCAMRTLVRQRHESYATLAPRASSWLWLWAFSESSMVAHGYRHATTALLPASAATAATATPTAAESDAAGRTRESGGPTFSHLEHPGDLFATVSRYFHQLGGSGNHATIEESVLVTKPVVNRVSVLASAFESVLGSPIRSKAVRPQWSRGREIDTVRLLRASWKLAQTCRLAGQYQLAKDLESSLLKVEALYYRAPAHSRRTIQALLTYEKSLGIHGRHGQLHSPSAAVGLLWLRRTIASLYKYYDTLLESLDKGHYQHPMDAALSAYASEIAPYHTEAHQRLYTLQLQASKPMSIHQVLSQLAGDVPASNWNDQAKDESVSAKTMESLDRLLCQWRPLLAWWKQVFVDLDLEDRRRV